MNKEVEKNKEQTIDIEIKNILEYINKRGIKNLTANEITRAIYKLSFLSIKLGERVAHNVMNVNSAYVYRKFKYAKAFVRIKNKHQKSTIKEIEQRAERRLKNVREEEIMAQYEADKDKAFYENLKQIITVLQTRVKYLVNKITDK